MLITSDPLLSDNHYATMSAFATASDQVGLQRPDRQENSIISPVFTASPLYKLGFMLPLMLCWWTETAALENSITKPGLCVRRAKKRIQNFLISGSSLMGYSQVV